MNRQHHISLREEFDEHDGDGTKYIVLLDAGYPVATCRFFETAPGHVTLGRVVVLPEYRGRKLGVMDASIVTTSMMMQATDLGLATLWARGFNASYIESAFEFPDNLKLAWVTYIFFRKFL